MPVTVTVFRAPAEGHVPASRPAPVPPGAEAKRAVVWRDKKSAAGSLAVAWAESHQAAAARCVIKWSAPLVDDFSCFTSEGSELSASGYFKFNMRMRIPRIEDLKYLRFPGLELQYWQISKHTH